MQVIIHDFRWDVITRPCLYFNCGSAKPLVMLAMGVLLHPTLFIIMVTS